MMPFAGPPMDETMKDPYRRCEDELNERGFVIKQGRCSHDLALGVLVEELLAGDGPFPGGWAASISPMDAALLGTT